MATIGKLSIMLTASAAQFVSGVKKAAGATAGLTKKLSGLVSLGGLVKTAIAAIGVGGFIAYVKHALESTVATIKLARAVGATTEGLITLQHEVKSLGGEAEAVGRGLGVLNERLSGVGVEADYAEDVLARLGLKAGELAKLPTDQAFRSIADAIARIPDPMQRAAIASALFGADAAALLPALAAGGKGMDEAGNRAKALGLAFSTVDGSQIEDANAKLDMALDIFKGITTQIAVQLAPWIIAAIDSLGSFGDTGVSVGKVVAESFRIIAKSIAFVIDAARLAGAGLVTTLQLALVTLIYLVTKGLQKLFEAAGKLPDKLGGAAFREAAEGIKAYADGAEETGREIVQRMKDEWNAPGAMDAVDKFFNDIESKAKRTALALQSISKKTAGGATQLAGRFSKLFAEGAQVFQQNQTPLEKFGQEFQKLQTLLQSGAIGWDTYARAVSKGVGELEKAHGLSEVKLPAGLTRESSEAVSAINQQEAANNRRFRESPQERIKRIMEQSLEIERQQMEYMRRIAEAFQPKQPVRI